MNELKPYLAEVVHKTYLSGAFSEIGISLRSRACQVDMLSVLIYAVQLKRIFWNMIGSY